MSAPAFATLDNHNRNQQRQHRRQISTLTTEEPKFICQCGRRFSLLPNYETHRRNECGRVFKCNLCPILTSAKRSLISHQKRVHNIKTTNAHFVSNYDV